MRVVVLLIVATACGGSQKTKDHAISGPDSRRLTGAECEMVVDHAIDLLDADATTKDLVAAMRTQRPHAVEECVARATKRDFDCYMHAQNLVDLKTCDDQEQGAVTASVYDPD